MSKIHIWIGKFHSETEFEKYMDQSAFRQWWADNDEDNLELSCPFCKELGIASYDEDFLIMKYTSNGLSELLNLIPANTDKIKQAICDKNIEIANAAIIYNSGGGISSKRAENAKSVSYLDSFPFELNPEGLKTSTAGLRYMIWVGTTNKSKEEFLEYFNQEEYLKEMRDYEAGHTKKRPNPELRCQFCKDLNIKFYYPEFLRINITEDAIDSLELVQGVIQDDNIPDRWIERSLEKNDISSLNNCVFCYIPNGFRDKKRDQKVYIVKEGMKGHLGIPKKHIDELSSYNGIRYLATYEWE